MDELQQLLAALGASNFAEALTMINGFNGFLSDARVATATNDMQGARAAIQANGSLIRSLEAATGKQGSEALATALAWKQGAEDAVKAKSELEALRKEQASTEARTKLDTAVAEGRLAPANRQAFEDLFTNHGMVTLDAAIAALPVATNKTPGAPPPGQPPTGSNPSALSDADRAVAEQMGLTAEEFIQFQAKHGPRAA